jgi:hypothetical protein
LPSPGATPGARAAGPGFSPLDEALGLLPGSLTPWLAEGAVLLGGDSPFATACRTLAHFTGTTIAAATARRLTEAAGAAWVQMDLAEVTRLEAAPTAAVPAGAAVQQVSVDGVFVPLVGGEWREVKVLAIGAVATDGDGGVRTTDLSYCARLADAARFGREALAELHRRGTLGAPTVVAVADGAEWIQGFWDLHVPGAVRVLDFAHAAGYLARAAQDAFGPGTGETSAWLGIWLHELKHGDPDRVLAARREEIRYAEFVAAGYPIGSGCVESAGKLLIQARLCGAGMRWAEHHVDALLGLRAVTGTVRWDGAWDRIAGQLRRQARQVRADHRTARLAAATLPPPLPLQAAAPPADPPPVAVLARPKRMVDGRPTAAHPWKRPGPAARARRTAPTLPKL